MTWFIHSSWFRYQSMGIVLTIDWYLNHEEWMNHVTSGDYQNYYQDMYKNK